MTTLTVNLRPDEARAFRDLARLLGMPEEVLARDIVRAFVAEKAADKDVQAGLKAIEKLRREGRISARTTGTTKAEKKPRTRVAQGRSLTNLPDGIEVVFEGTVAQVRDGCLELNGERFSSPSPAAVHVAGGGSYNGWVVWKDRRGRTLAEIHQSFVDAR